MKHILFTFGAWILLASTGSTAAHAIAVQNTTELRMESRTPGIEASTQDRAYKDIDREEKMRENSGVKAELRSNFNADTRNDARIDVRTNARVNAESRIEILADWMVQKFEAAVDRLEKLATRIESRIEKMDAEGSATAEAKTYLAEARAEIELANTGTQNLPSLFAEAFAKTELRGAFAEIRSQSAEIRTHIRSAHASLVKALTEIKSEASLRARVEIDAE